MPAIKTAEGIEAELDALLGTNEEGFRQKQYEFLSAIQTVCNGLAGDVAGQGATTLGYYKTFLQTVLRILEERKTDLLPRQANLFTTNYDLFVERAAEDIPSLRLNDGFQREPTVRSKFRFLPEVYSDITYKRSTLYRNTVPAPSANLVKLHGSLSWRLAGSDIIYDASPKPVPAAQADISAFLDSFAVVLPTHHKFEQTLLERTYYDLLRILANALDVENTVLISYGFSFDDAHIRDITTKALRNPTLLLIVFAHSSDRVAGYLEKFDGYNNVVVFHPDAETAIDFATFSGLLASAIPKDAYAA